MSRIALAILLLHLRSPACAAQAQDCPFFCSGSPDPRVVRVYRLPCNPAIENSCGSGRQCAGQCGTILADDEGDVPMKLVWIPLVLLGIAMVCCCVFCKHFGGRLVSVELELPRGDPNRLERGEERPQSGPKLLGRGKGTKSPRSHKQAKQAGGAPKEAPSIQGFLRTQGFQSPTQTGSTATSPCPSPGSTSLAPSTKPSEHDGSEHGAGGSRKGSHRRSRSEGASRRAKRRAGSPERGGGHHRSKSTRSGSEQSSGKRSETSSTSSAPTPASPRGSEKRPEGAQSAASDIFMPVRARPSQISTDDSSARGKPAIDHSCGTWQAVVNEAQRLLELEEDEDPEAERRQLRAIDDMLSQVSRGLDSLELTPCGRMQRRDMLNQIDALEVEFAARWACVAILGAFG